MKHRMPVRSYKIHISRQIMLCHKIIDELREKMSILCMQPRDRQTIELPRCAKFADPFFRIGNAVSMDDREVPMSISLFKMTISNIQSVQRAAGHETYHFEWGR